MRNKLDSQKHIMSFTLLTNEYTFVKSLNYDHTSINSDRGSYFG